MQSGSPLEPAPRRKDAAGGLKIQEAVTAAITAAQPGPGEPQPLEWQAVQPRPQGTPVQAAGPAGQALLGSAAGWGRTPSPETSPSDGNKRETSPSDRRPQRLRSRRRASSRALLPSPPAGTEGPRKPLWTLTGLRCTEASIREARLEAACPPVAPALSSHSLRTSRPSPCLVTSIRITWDELEERFFFPYMYLLYIEKNKSRPYLRLNTYKVLDI